VATSQTTTSTTYTDLTTAGPAVSVTIPASGKALVILTGQLSNNGSGDQAFMGYAVSGVTTVAAADSRALMMRNYGGSTTPFISVQASATYLVSGLNAGSNTFTAKYRVDSSTGTFVNRNIIVIPLP
jgi:hypothetical protein